MVASRGEILIRGVKRRDTYIVDIEQPQSSDKVPEIIRLAICENMDGRKTCVARLSLSKNSEREWNAQLSGDPSAPFSKVQDTLG